MTFSLFYDGLARFQVGDDKQDSERRVDHREAERES